MIIFLITLLTFSVFIALMAVGLLAGRDPLRRGCGGFGNAGVPHLRCEHCGTRTCPNAGTANTTTKESSNEK